MQHEAKILLHSKAIHVYWSIITAQELNKYCNITIYLLRETDYWSSKDVDRTSRKMERESWREIFQIVTPGKEQNGVGWAAVSVQRSFSRRICVLQGNNKKRAWNVRRCE